jgi:hypothetical protein
MRLEMSADIGTRTASPSPLSYYNFPLNLSLPIAGWTVAHSHELRRQRTECRRAIAYEERPGPAGAPVSFQSFSQFQSPDVSSIGNGKPS